MSKSGTPKEIVLARISDRLSQLEADASATRTTVERWESQLNGIEADLKAILARLSWPKAKNSQLWWLELENSELRRSGAILICDLPVFPASTSKINGSLAQYVVNQMQDAKTKAFHLETVGDAYVKSPPKKAPKLNEPHCANRGDI